MADRGVPFAAIRACLALGLFHVGALDGTSVADTVARRPSALSGCANILRHIRVARRKGAVTVGGVRPTAAVRLAAALVTPSFARRGVADAKVAVPLTAELGVALLLLEIEVALRNTGAIPGVPNAIGRAVASIGCVERIAMRIEPRAALP